MSKRFGSLCKWVSLGLLVCLAAVGVRQFLAKGQLKVDPTTVKDDTARAKYLSGGKPYVAEGDPLDPQTRTTESSANLRLEWLDREKPSQDWPGKVVYLKAGERWEIAGGSVAILATGVGFAETMPRLSWSDYALRDIPGKFFDPGLRPLGTNELEPYFSRYQRGFEYRGTFPEWKIVLGTTNLPGAKFLGSEAYDARTGARLVTGWSRQGDAARSLVELDCAMWHQGPVQFCQGLALGPPAVLEVQAKVGGVLDLPNGQIFIQGMAALPAGKKVNGWSSGRNQSREPGADPTIHTNTMTLDLVEAPGESEARTWLALEIRPSATSSPVEIQFSDAEGRLIETSNQGSSGSTSFHIAHAPVERIATLRALCHTNLYRLVWEFPEIPGLPEENRGVENLLDVRVPFVLAREPWRHREFLSRALQIGIPHLNTPGAATPGYPRAFTNETLRTILADYTRQFPQPAMFVYDEERKELILEEPFPKRFLKRLRKLFP